MSVTARHGQESSLGLTVDPTDVYQRVTNTARPAAPTPAPPVVVGDIPAQRLGFQPRPRLLTELNRSGQEPPVVVLTGSRGAGKTQLAAAFARARLAGGWRLIAWVNAGSAESLLAGWTAVADAVAGPDEGARAEAADPVQALRDWLEADGRHCLLVFDGAADLDLVRPILPAAGAARTLITMAGEPAAGLGTSVPVGEFSADEALALLIGRTGRADEAGAAAVAAELGHLPLALDQAATVIAGQHLEYEAYLAKLRTHRDGDDLGPAEQPYPPGVAAAVRLSLEAAWAADPLGACSGVMDIMSVLSPAVVRRDLLHTAGNAGTLLGGRRRMAALLVDQALYRLYYRCVMWFCV
jgi:hypothetical protein